MSSPRTGRSRYRGPVSEWINVVVEIERPSAASLVAYSRSERYKILRQNAETRRAALEAWAAREGLCDKITVLKTATAFNLLFVKCTPDAAEQLPHAPGVVEVLLAGDLPGTPLRVV
ncbi:MAG: hypothetical protein H3C34_13470 [Caldilineaceae bacterium]|nr:hypothetical protein [Caldilineaceae bacterium]